MAMPTPDQAAAAWAQRLAASGDKITQGVQAVTVAPGQAAARQKAVYAQNVAAATDKWAARVGSVSLGEWQQATIQKGAPRVAAGAAAAQPKMQDFMAQFLPHVASVVGGLPPRGGIDQNINRMTQAVRGFAKFQRR